MMTTEEWNDKPRGKEYSAEPEFDANGWCHDMSKATKDAELHLYGPLRDGSGYYQDICRFFGGRWSVEWMDNYLAPTAWRPLPLPPVKEQDQ